MSDPRKCPVCGGDVTGEEMIFTDNCTLFVYKCDDEECGWRESDAEVIDRLSVRVAELEKENADLLSQIDRYLVQSRDDIECEARIGVNGELRYIIPPPTKDPAGTVLASSDEFVRVLIHVIRRADK